MGKIRKPLTKGVANVPYISPLEHRECGAACLSMVAAYFGKRIPIDQSRVDCGVGRNGVSAGAIVRAAREYGIEAHGYTLETEALRTKVTYPCIIHWRMKHFVVLCGFRGKYAVIVDPDKGRLRIDPETFEKSFTGICLQLSPANDFEPSNEPMGGFGVFGKYLKGLAPVISVTTVVLILNALFGYLDPMLRGVFLDRVLGGSDSAFMLHFIYIMAAVAAAEILISLFDNLFRLYISGKMAEGASYDFLRRLLYLPSDFYDQRSTSELTGRMKKYSNLGMSLVNTLAPLAIQIAMMIFYLIVMIRQSLILTAIGIATVAINLFVSRYIAARRIDHRRRTISDNIRLTSTTVTGLEMMEMIQATGAKEGYMDRWRGYQAVKNNARVNFMRTDRYLAVIPAYLSTAANYVVMASGVLLTIRGEFTLGLMSAFSGYLMAFMMPVDSIINIGQTVTAAGVDLERIEDVMEHPLDPYAGFDEITGTEAKGVSEDKLSGAAQMRGVTFSYEKYSDPAVKDIDLTLEPQKRIGIVGRSGSGKTTVLRLLTGQYIPDQGDITFDGHSIGDIGHCRFTASVAYVDQEIRLFNDSVLENIRMWDETVSREQVIRAAEDAMIDEDIMAVFGGYDGQIRENGQNLSGGQRQRIDIARALCQDPSVLILDEATGALDEDCERKILDAIKRRGIALILVSHRLSAIRDFDEIIVMDHGTVVSRGTHEELIAGSEAYRSLVETEGEAKNAI